jgi:flagellar motor switch/type III secretory pathway protein FliN
MRLGGASLEEIQRKLRRSLASFVAALRPSLGAGWQVTLGRVAEANARMVFAEGQGTRVVAFFRLQGAPSSLVWSTGAAGAAVDLVLGSSSEAAGERKLSHVESKLASDILLALAQAVARALGLALGDFELLTDEEAIRLRLDDLREVDPHRVEIELGLAGPSALAPLCIQVGGLRPDVAPAPPPTRELGGQIGEVELELRARIGDRELPLTQVLGLEQGDVIPLSALPALALLSVEGRDFARARLGVHRGRLALRIESLLSEG